ncbi:MAG: acyltransferase domain-containing protein, partial [Planctomycetales bacterium]|nr:acyltransferase domain-containing protein [Planctomycetales bacterium]
MSLALVFPGQGAQAVGMGRDLAQKSPAARAVFERADRALGFAISRLCFDGPEAELTRTEVSQPALYVAGLAALAALEERLGRRVEAVAGAGLSLGEYTALAAGGAFSLEDGLRL